jgi:hypothetical protein
MWLFMRDRGSCRPSHLDHDLINDAGGVHAIDLSYGRCAGPRWLRAYDIALQVHLRPWNGLASPAGLSTRRRGAGFTCCWAWSWTVIGGVAIVAGGRAG